VAVHSYMFGLRSLAARKTFDVNLVKEAVLKKVAILFMASLVASFAFISRVNAASVAYASGTGSGSACTPSAPCGFISAVSSVDDGGLVKCLDAGPYVYTGVGFAKSMTIDCPGAIRITFPNFGAIQLNGTSSQMVRIRNAIFDGGSGGWPAIRVLGSPTLFLENCVFQNHNAGNAIAIEFKPNAPGAQLIMTDTVVDDNGIMPSSGGGLQVAPSPGGGAGVILNRVRFGFNVTAMVLNSGSGGIGTAIKDSQVISSRSNGILVQAGTTINFVIDRSSLTNNVGNALQTSGANSHVYIGNSTIFGNDVGVSAEAGTVQSFKNNQIFGNGTDGTPLPAVPGATGGLQ
jgi:hypothetical protein